MNCNGYRGPCSCEQCEQKKNTLVALELTRDSEDCLRLTTRCATYKIVREDGDELTDGEFEFLKSMQPALIDKMIEDDLLMERESMQDHPRHMCKTCGVNEASIHMDTCWLC